MFETEALCTGVKAPVYLSFTTATLSVLLCLLTVPGNLMVCLAIYKDPYKDLRSPFIFLVTHLSVADLIVGLITEPISVFLHVREGLGLPIYNIWLLHMSYFISCTASVLSIGAIAMDRYLAIKHPMEYRARHGSMTTKIASALIWVISLTVPFAYFQVGYIPYTFVFANTTIVVTLLILIIIFVKIHRSSNSRVVVIGGGTTNNGDHHAHAKILTREKKITNTFLVVLVSFVCCYTPSCVMIYLMNLCVTCDCETLHWLRDMQFIFVLLSSFTNPVIYAWRLGNFRKAFVAMVTCKARSSSRDLHNIEDPNMAYVNTTRGHRSQLGV